MELWWDSSPLIYEEWKRGRGVDLGDVIRGSTTNQPLTLQTIELPTSKLYYSNFHKKKLVV